MAKRPLVTCRVCHQKIDRDATQENVDWINPSTNYFYHVQCYQNFKQKKNDVHAQMDDEEWFNILKDYLYKDIKCPVNFSKLTSQWKRYCMGAYTAKGIFFAMKYFFDVQKGTPDKSDGIGIIPYIYKDSCQYWRERESREEGIVAKIEAQMKHAQEQQHIVIRQKAPVKKKADIDLSIIAGMEDEE